MSSDFYSRLDQRAVASFPSLANLSGRSWDHLISPHTIELPSEVLKQARDVVRAFFALSRRSAYQSALDFDTVFPFQTANTSVAMAYDFHLSAGNLKLVEINTNASGFLISNLMTAAHSGTPCEKLESWSALRSSFENEAEGRTRAVIVDDDVLNQKMYIEFLMYQSAMEQWGWRAEIREASDEIPDGDLVYNRTTDFYLKETAHARLESAWKAGRLILTPQPKEYFLLADKERLVEMTRANWLEEAGATPEEASLIRGVLIPTYSVGHFESQEELWSRRRSFFFKPKRSHGGKSVYRGESITKKVFARLVQEDPLIQDFVPAPAVPLAGLEDWKYDLRFFVYRDQVQQVAARIYQGQVTNFRTPGGGFTRVEFR